MARRIKGTNRGFLIYVCAICFALCVVAFFLPSYGQYTDTGSLVYFDPIVVLFGGECKAVVDGVTYTYSFSLNFPVLLLMLFDVVGFIFAISAKNSPGRIAGTMIIAVISMFGIVGAKFIIVGANPSISGDNFAFVNGYFLSLVACFVCIVVAVIELILSLIYWHKRNAFR